MRLTPGIKGVGPPLTQDTQLDMAGFGQGQQLPDQIIGKMHGGWRQAGRGYRERVTEEMEVVGPPEVLRVVRATDDPIPISRMDGMFNVEHAELPEAHFANGAAHLVECCSCVERSWLLVCGQSCSKTNTPRLPRLVRCALDQLSFLLSD